MDDDTSTLTVEGFTPYAQVPRWVVRSGGALSGNAVHLYSVLMTYADNGSKAAFPSRSTLAGDMGRSLNTVKRAMAELESFGALRVTRRRSKSTGANISNLYVLVFADPRPTDGPGVGSPVSRKLDPLPTTPTPSSLPVASSTDDADSSLPFASPPGDAAALKAAALAMYQDGCEDPDDFIDLYETVHPGASTDVGHLIINCWGPEGTTDRIDRKISRGRQLGKTDPARWGIAAWVRALPGITHGTLGGA